MKSEQLNKAYTGFTPIKLQEPPSRGSNTNNRLVLNGTIHGRAAEDFDKLREQYGLTKQQLLVQMVHHCLGRTSELKDFYRRLAILGE